MSWIAELERLEQLSQNPMREYSEKIPFTILYINKDNHIESVLHKSLCLDETNIIRKERLLKLVSSYSKTNNDSKFICKEILFFNIPIEPEKINQFSQNTFLGDYTSSSQYLQKFPVIDDIHIDPSLFIFHTVNKLYFMFFETQLPARKLKSCLKGDTSKKIGKMTKRVRINVPRNTRKKQI
jgi:hypothetical protein